MPENFIKIRGARVHNLRNINVDIPKNKLVVITGISGSGKSSLAFDTLYAEGQRRYVESLSAYARQFLGVMDKPDVDKIEGISPAISIDQRKAVHNPRSTVGTMTEIYDYLRLLFARAGLPHCPKCGREISSQTIDQITRQVLKIPALPKTVSRGGPKSSEIIILGPVARGKKGEHHGTLEEIQKAGFVRVRIDGVIFRTEEALEKEIDKNKKHDIEVVVDRLVLPACRSLGAGGDKDLDPVRDSGDKKKAQNKQISNGVDKSRLADSLETALKVGKGMVIVSTISTSRGVGDPKPTSSPALRQDVGAKSAGEYKDEIFSENFACETCGISLQEIEPRLFSFNSPFGACPSCQGLGKRLIVDPKLVIPNQNLTLDEGAIMPWARASHKIGRQGFFWSKLSDLAESYNFPLDVPVKELPKNVVELILNGNGDFAAHQKMGAALSGASLAPLEREPRPDEMSGWEGVIPWIERKYHETDSEWAREEISQYMVEKICEACQGKRLRPEVLAITIAGKSINDIVSMPIEKVKNFFEKEPSLSREKKSLEIIQPIVKEIINRLQFLVDVGLDYLALNRKTETLSGGEEQRIRLATQIGSKLTGVLYILDEPSIGLHVRDQKRLIGTLRKLQEIGNSVIVVEHDPQTIKSADWIIDVGPGAGKHGGKIIFQGTPAQLLKSHTLTGDYLSGRKTVEVRSQPRRQRVGAPKPTYGRLSDLSVGDEAPENTKLLIIKGAQEHNLKNIDVKIPLGKFVCISGVSGSGKSSLVNDILAKALLKKFYNAKDEPGKYKAILGLEYLNKVVLVDQSPIGRTPRSNPATYTNSFVYIRDLFAGQKEAKIRGYRAGRFSFNVKGGRCEACEGQGVKKIEMYFLPDVYVECEECKGKRFNKETLLIEYKGKNISDVLQMTVEEALEFFKNIPPLHMKLKTLYDVGLGYIQLGQSAPSLSGGEAQRVKLADELSRRESGRSLYILDEPTTGLHFDDIKKLIQVLRGLVDKGNTVLIIEHQLNLIACSDWIIDLGPEGGEQGGWIVAEGTPKEISACKKSYTGQFLKGNL
ncbi:MAG: excinuclease ABC subunit UvrA [Patescibacteria group bacterium]